METFGPEYMGERKWDAHPANENSPEVLNTLYMNHSFMSSKYSLINIIINFFDKTLNHNYCNYVL